MPSATVWVVAEPDDGHPSRSTLELVTAAGRLGRRVEAFTWGPGGRLARDLGHYAVARTHQVVDLDDSLPGPSVAAAMAGRVVAGDVPDVVLAAPTPDGRDIVGRLSARLDRPVLANVVGFERGDPPVSCHPFGTNRVVTARFTGPRPYLFLVRPRSFPPAEVRSSTAAEVVTVVAPVTGRTGEARVVAHHATEPHAAALDDASVVVAGGRGLGDAEGFALVTRLARLLGGATGATGAAVDAGWAPRSWQIGQTGRTVAPDLYVACGISGAAQHTVGMRDARHVVAINNDPAAPIFSVADLGVVGDAGAVLPRLIDAVQAHRNGYR